MQKSSTRMIVEAGLMVAILAVILLIGTYIPLLRIVIFVFSVPLTVMYLRHTPTIAVLTIIATSLIGALVNPDFRWIMIPLLSGPLALCMGFCMKKKWSASVTLFFSTLVASIGFIVFFQVLLFVMPVPNMEKSLVGFYAYIFGEGAKMLKDMNLPQAQQVIKSNEIALTLVKEFTITIVASFGLVFSLINVFVLYKVMDRMKMSYKKPEPFANFVMPNQLMIAISVVFAIILFLGFTPLVDLKFVLSNILYMYVLIFLIQGTATSYGWLRNRGFQKGLAIAMIIMIFGFNLSIGIALIGWLDLIFDFRKLKKRDAEN